MFKNSKTNTTDINNNLPTTYNQRLLLQLNKTLKKYIFKNATVVVL